jgi:TonB family protein
MKLLQTVFEVPHISFTNSFFTNSLIKSRIMMLQKKSNPRKTWRYALALPVIALMLFLNCTQEIQTKVEPEANLTENELIDLYVKNAKQKMEQGESYEAQLNLLKQEYDLKPDKNLKLNMVTLYTLVTNDKKSPYRKIDDYTNEGLNYKENPDAIPFSLVNTVPVYENADPTDKDFFQNYIQKHIRKNFVYPNEALDAGIQGRVYLSFVIDEKGKVHVENVRGPDTTLENACIEIFEKMPNASTPATLNGESVAMKMSVPITFKIQ